jgi:3-(3-hydroxy-phenyl)propionate hydroxylase
VIFAGDSAHVVSPFGARGGNGGIQDIDNLCWKLAAVLKGEAPARLLLSYDEERTHGADENIQNSARATSFMSPRPGIERLFRDEVLSLAADLPFARRLVNSGRLSQPCSLAGLSLQTPAEGEGLAPGTPCPDAPDGTGWLMNRLGGRFHLLAVGDARVPDGISLDCITTFDAVARQRYGDRTLYLIRPDQHIAARLTGTSAAAIRAAHARALGRAP